MTKDEAVEKALKNVYEAEAAVDFDWGMYFLSKAQVFATLANALPYTPTIEVKSNPESPKQLIEQAKRLTQLQELGG